MDLQTKSREPNRKPLLLFPLQMYLKTNEFEFQEDYRKTLKQEIN